MISTIYKTASSLMWAVLVIGALLFWSPAALNLSRKLLPADSMLGKFASLRLVDLAAQAPEAPDWQTYHSLELGMRMTSAQMERVGNAILKRADREDATRSDLHLAAKYHVWQGQSSEAEDYLLKARSTPLVEGEEEISGATEDKLDDSEPKPEEQGGQVDL